MTWNYGILHSDSSYSKILLKKRKERNFGLFLINFVSIIVFEYSGKAFRCTVYKHCQELRNIIWRNIDNKFFQWNNFFADPGRKLILEMVTTMCKTNIFFYLTKAVLNLSYLEKVYEVQEV